MKGWDILRRAWSTLWRYRALWVIGAILAFTSLSLDSLLLLRGPSSSELTTEDSGLLMPLPSGARIMIPGRASEDGESGRLVVNYKHAADQVRLNPGDMILSYNPPDQLSVGVVARQGNGGQLLVTHVIRPATVKLIKAGLIAAVALGVVLSVAVVITRYVGEAALIRMVDASEETGVQRSLRQGLKFGWSKTAWQLFLINATIRIPAALLVTGAFLLALSPLSLVNTASKAVTAIVVVVSVTMLLVGGLVLPVLAVALSVLTRLARQACAVDGMGVVGSIGAALSMLRGHLPDVAMMWLQMLGVRIAWGIAGVLVGLVIVIIAGLAGAIPVVVTGGLGALAGGEALLAPGPWIASGLVGLIVFLLVLALPMALFDGLRIVLQSSAWTLTYRELSRGTAAG